MNIRNYEVDKNFAVLSRIDSMGSQVKFFDGEYWYKYDALGCEGLAEQLVSDLLSCTNISDYVTYEHCKINGKSGCKSKTFLADGEQLVTFQTLYKNTHKGALLSDKIRELPDASKRFDFLVQFLADTTGLDATTYLYQNLALDMIIKNPDRHFENLALILDKEGRFRFAPIFDNGQGLTANFQMTPPILEPEEKEAILCGATISGSFETQYLAAKEAYRGIPLMIDYDRLSQLLAEKYPAPSIVKNDLLASIEKYKALFPDFHKDAQPEKEESNDEIER